MPAPGRWFEVFNSDVYEKLALHDHQEAVAATMAW
jgi:hypothetical protein